MTASIETPFFSVVVPVYNKGPHIQRSIGSVLNQTFQDFELILVNDASTDNSLDEIQKFTDPRIRILHRDEPGPGGYAARNLGIKEARAEWVAFLDADDEWYPEHLERMYRLSLEFDNVSVMGCGYEIIYSAEDKTSKTFCSYYSKHKDLGNHYLSFENYLQAEVKGLRPTWTSVTCIKKYILRSTGGFPEGKAKRGGDVDTWLRCIEHAGGCAWGDYIGGIYYRDSLNMCTRTEIFLAEVERDTVKKLLTRYDGNSAKLLKKFANRRTLAAWSQNCQLVGSSNFSLIDKLYLTEDIHNNFVWLIFSMMPISFFLKLKKIQKYWKSIL
jgi:glycosyltransferase involved in cell wall biosynthesis